MGLVTQEKTINFRHVKEIALKIHAVLQVMKPDRLTAVCAMLELAIATLKNGEPLKHDLEATYKRHVKPKSSLILPPNMIS